MLQNKATGQTGEKVVAGQVSADSKNTKNGVLSIREKSARCGDHWKGLIYEVRVIFSPKAATRLSSEHLRESTGHLDPNSKVYRNRYISQTISTRFRISGENEDKLDKAT